MAINKEKFGLFSYSAGAGFIVVLTAFSSVLYYLDTSLIASPKIRQIKKVLLPFQGGVPFDQIAYT